MAEPPSIHEVIEELVPASPDERFSSPTEARKKAMDYLARREHGRGELLDKVVRAGFEMAAAEQAIDGLIDDGLQSDDRFAEAFVQSRINQGKGPARIRADLQQKGLSASAVDQAIDAADVDWRALAVEVRTRKFGADRPRDFKEKARQMRFLQYRGFDADAIRTATGDDD